MTLAKADTRIQKEVKEKLQEIATRESRSFANVLRECLAIGTEKYLLEKEGKTNHE